MDWRDLIIYGFGRIFETFDPALQGLSQPNSINRLDRAAIL